MTVSQPDRESIHRAVDELSKKSLVELRAFIADLRHKQTHPDSAWFRATYDAFAPVRAAIEKSGMSEDDINAVIDEAIDEVRRGDDA